MRVLLEIIYQYSSFINYQVDKIGWKKRFATINFNSEDKIFIVHIILLTSFDPDIHLFCRDQLTFIFVDKAFKTTSF